MSFEKLSDDLIIKEASKRLIKIVKRKMGIDLMHGNFIINIYKGHCSKVEFNLKQRCIDLKPRVINGGENE